MNWNDENYLDEFYKKYSMMGREGMEASKAGTALRKMFFSYMHEMGRELDAEILTKRTFDHKSITFTYYLN